MGEGVAFEFDCGGQANGDTSLSGGGVGGVVICNNGEDGPADKPHAKSYEGRSSKSGDMDCTGARMAVLYDGVRLSASRSKAGLNSGAVRWGGMIAPGDVFGDRCMLCRKFVERLRRWKRLL